LYINLKKVEKIQLIYYLCSSQKMLAMDKIRLNILGISYSQTQNGAYALVLAEENGKRRIPIIIGASEAQSIALQLEGLTPLRPLTHDLFVSLSKAFSINLIMVTITKLDEGIFYSELVCKQDNKKIKLDARTSDAVALALRFNCPIYTNDEIMEKAGIVFESSGDTPEDEEQTAPTQPNLKAMSIDELELRLTEAIENEEYELASSIKEEIQRRSETK